jgi:uncharacterized protein YbbC (DUF1343 family)
MTTFSHKPTLFGIDRFQQGDWRPAPDARLGLLMNQASVSGDFTYAHLVAAQSCPGQLRAIFTPQHGLWGEAQANMIESPHGFDDQRQIPIYSLYSETRRPAAKMLTDIDELLIDLQDVGTRVYTFIWTVLECLRACRDHHVRVSILDRPNPIGAAIEGPLLLDEFRSFVGGAAIPMRHGLTIGELASWLNVQLAIGADLTVVKLANWNRELGFPTNRSWIPTSPNLPTVESCLVYPGQVLLEGTNLSEGRGTTRPFQLCGAPYIDENEMAIWLQSVSLPAIQFLPARFTPTFDKWAGKSCGGVSLHVVDAELFRPYETSVTLLAYAAGQHAAHFQWLEPPYEYERYIPPIDIISGSDKLRLALNQSADLPKIADLPKFAASAIALDQEFWLRDTAAVRLYG